MKKRILWLGLSFLLVAALVLASCGEAEVGEQEEEEEPQHGGTLTHYIFPGEAAGADVANDGWPTQVFAAPVIDYLIMGDFEQYGPRGTDECSFQVEQYIPAEFWKGALAESWDVTADKITFHIRQGVYWAADGKEHVMESRELTADDVAWSLNRFLDSSQGGSGSMRTENGGWIDSIYDEDDTVVVETSSYNASWIFWIANGWGNGIYAPEVVAAGASDWDNLVGTGPFMLKESVTGSHITYERNPNFWGTATINGVEYDDIPFIDELVHPIIPDESTRIANLRTGQIDLYYAVPMLYEDTLAQSSPELLKKNKLSSWVSVVTLRTDREPFDDVAVRQALMTALDQEAILRAISGEGVSYTWPVSPELSSVHIPLDELSAATQELFEYDPVTARQMLDDALGHTDGITGVEILVRADDALLVDMAEMVVSYWDAIGVETTLRPVEVTTFYAVIAAGEHDCTVGVESVANPFKTFRLFVPGEWNNFALYDNEYFTAQLLEAEQMLNAVEQDAVLRELFEILVDEVVYIAVGAPYLLTYWWPWVNNYYGEFEVSCWSRSHLMAAAWIDQDMKADMGY